MDILSNPRYNYISNNICMQKFFFTPFYILKKGACLLLCKAKYLAIKKNKFFLFKKIISTNNFLICDFRMAIPLLFIWLAL